MQSSFGLEQQMEVLRQTRQRGRKWADREKKKDTVRWQTGEVVRSEKTERKGSGGRDRWRKQNGGKDAHEL